MEKIRILVLTHEYPPIGGGGGRVAQDVCTRLAERGFDVRILTAHYSDLPEEEHGTVTIYRIHSGRTQPFRASLKAMLGYVVTAVFRGIKLIRSWKPDVIHVHFAVPGGAAAWALHLLTGIPYVLTVHLGDVPGGVPEKTSGWFRWVYPLTPLIWRKAARVTAVSEYTRELAREHYPVPVEVVFNGVDLQVLDPGEITANPIPVVIFAGRFVDQKNPLQIVQALAGLKQLSWRCIMLGDGILRPEVERLIAVNQMQDRFELPGWVTPEEVVEHFRHSDILVLSSKVEGLPVVGVQACAMGLALVLNRVGGCVDLIEENHNGFLIDPAEPEDFQRALEELLSSNEKLKAFRLASREVAQKFDLDAVAELYARILEEASKK